MALAIIVTLEKEVPALAPYRKSATGRALAREADRLDFAARRCHAAALSSYLSENPSVLAEQMKAEGFDPSKMRLPVEQWYLPAEGLKSIRALIEDVTAHLNDFKQPNPILRDLKAAETLLAAAEMAGVKFHFSKTEI